MMMSRKKRKLYDCMQVTNQPARPTLTYPTDTQTDLHVRLLPTQPTLKTTCTPDSPSPSPSPSPEQHGIKKKADQAEVLRAKREALETSTGKRPKAKAKA